MQHPESQTSEFPVSGQDRDVLSELRAPEDVRRVGEGVQRIAAVGAQSEAPRVGTDRIPDDRARASRLDPVLAVVCPAGDACPNGTVGLAGTDPDPPASAPSAPFLVDYVDSVGGSGCASIQVAAALPALSARGRGALILTIAACAAVVARQAIPIHLTRYVAREVSSPDPRSTGSAPSSVNHVSKVYGSTH